MQQQFEQPGAREFVKFVFEFAAETRHIAITADRFNCSTPLRFSLGIESSMGPSLPTARPPYIHDALDARFYKISPVCSREREDELTRVWQK